jgi:hypothetical protein
MMMITGTASMLQFDDPDPGQRSSRTRSTFNHLQYPNGLADNVGYWAEDRLKELEGEL